jgi:predicted glycosyl hydrolase (DUF1957 family)
VAIDQPFTVVENRWFRSLFRQAQLTIKSAGGVKKALLKDFQEFSVSVKRKLSLTNHVSLSLHAWTSPNKHSLLVIIVHFVDSDFEYHEHVIELAELSCHTAENLAHEVMETVSSYDPFRLRSSTQCACTPRRLTV